MKKEPNIFEKEIYCIIKIKTNYFKIIESGLTYNEAMKLKARLTEVINKHHYFIDITLSAENALKRYIEDVKRFNYIIDKIGGLENGNE